MPIGSLLELEILMIRRYWSNIYIIIIGKVFLSTRLCCEIFGFAQCLLFSSLFLDFICDGTLFVPLWHLRTVDVPGCLIPIKFKMICIILTASLNYYTNPR
jgi:hypothetical protein